MRDRIRRRNNLKRGTIGPRKAVVISGEPVSKWKSDDILGIYDLVGTDATGRPIYKVICVSRTTCFTLFQRRLANSLNKNVHLFYRVESEKWCLGPEPDGTYCWIYCDSKSKWPWLKTLRPFWHEHTGANNWENIPIRVDSLHTKTTEEWKYNNKWIK